MWVEGIGDKFYLIPYLCKCSTTTKDSCSLIIARRVEYTYHTTVSSTSKTYIHMVQHINETGLYFMLNQSWSEYYFPNNVELAPSNLILFFLNESHSCLWHSLFILGKPLKVSVFSFAKSLLVYPNI